MALFKLPKVVLTAWLVLVVFGAVSYTTLLTREGFPSVAVPLAIVNGTYLVNDPGKVDAEVAKPISDLALAQGNASTIQAQSQGNFFMIAIQYKENVDAHKAADALKKAVQDSGGLPETANVHYSVPYFGVTGGDPQKIDATISFYGRNNQMKTEDLVARAQKATEYLNEHKPSLVDNFFVRDPFQTAVNPLTGQTAVVQKTFDRYGERKGDTTTYHKSVVIGVTAVRGADVIKLDKELNKVLNDLDSQADFSGYHATISASYAPSINDEISELQRVLLEGLIAVLVVGSVVIAVRASLITVLSMITVITATLGVLYFIGYSLNVITLFALILGLSLIVDDTIIMVEALDASRRKQKKASEAVAMAVRKISRAMVAATLTAALSFAPLLFAGGILGKFIRAIPVTIISALLISLAVALIFIPLFARGLLLGKKQMGEQGVREFAAGFEAAIARAICRPMIWARNSRKKLVGVGLSAVMIGVVFIGAAGFIFSKVTFNLFPDTKDTNQLSVSLQFPAGTTIAQAEQITDKADAIVADYLGANFERATYFGDAGAQTATSQIDILSYEKRDITSKVLVDQLQDRFNNEFTEAKAKVAQLSVGPPASAFVTQIKTESRENGFRLANDIAAYMQTVELKRASGKVAHFKNVTVSSAAQYIRNNGVLSIQVSGDFDGTDTTTLVTLAQDAIKKKFDDKKLASYGLPKDVIGFDIGQESDNQNSFKTLVYAFPILMFVIYLLLAVQFRSLLQPLLIFMAIPFSLFGVTLSLYVTDNAFSFFVAMGFFALIGLSIKNTILLTDYANQARRAGMGAIDSAVEALGERFRPLIATSLTAVVSLIPLAITSPFWQGLAVVLIGGLLSSTLLVVTIFPYYYLGGEFIRMHITRKMGLS